MPVMIKHFRGRLVTTGIALGLGLALTGGTRAETQAAEPIEIESMSSTDIIDAVAHGDVTTQSLALELFYSRLYSSPDSRREALFLAPALEPYVVDPEQRVAFHLHVSGAYREQGDLALYEETLERLAVENPDVSTSAGYLAQYERVFELLREPNADYPAAIAILEPLLPYSEAISGFQRARIGVQLTNLYRKNGQYDKAIALAELTRSHVPEEDANRLALLADLAESYFATENYELAALTYDELAAYAEKHAHAFDLANPAFTWRHAAPEMAAKSRQLADARRPIEASSPVQMKTDATGISQPAAARSAPETVHALAEIVPRDEGISRLGTHAPEDVPYSSPYWRTIAMVSTAVIVALVGACATIAWRYRSRPSLRDGRLETAAGGPIDSLK